VIRSFGHKGLRRLFEYDDARGIQGEHRKRIENILGVLNVATKLEDMNIPGFKLHPLSGELKGFWSVTVRANWRIVFRFENGDAYDVALLDYH
jgi:proteic killer suppression protein